MSAETIPADVVELVAKTIHDHWQGAPGLSARPWDGEKGTCAKLPAQAEDFRRKARAVLKALATRPAEPAEPTVDTIAAFLHKEVEWPEDNYPAYTWPEVDGDTGQRDGGYVKIVPKYVVEEFRGIARRLLIAFRQEGAVSAESAAPVAEAGDGDVAASLAHLNIGYLYGIADALEHTDFTRASDIRQCLLQVVKGLSVSAATLEAERARAAQAEADLHEVEEQFAKLQEAEAQAEEEACLRVAAEASLSRVLQDRDFWKERFQVESRSRIQAEQRAADALARAEKAEGAGADDIRRLDWLEANTSAVISHEGFEDDVWQIHTVSGNRSDLEWTKRAEAETVRGAIDAAIRAAPPRDLSQGGQHG